MIVNDRLVYLELQKTGCTQIANAITAIVGGERTGKHERILEGVGDRFILGSVRSPWSWYVSIWAYGCNQRGQLYHHLTRCRPAWQRAFHAVQRGAIRPRDIAPRAAMQYVRGHRKNPAWWNDTYRDPLDIDGFRRWLRAILDKDRAAELPFLYASSPASDHVGFFTFRYLWLFLADPTMLNDYSLVGDFPRLLAADYETNVCNDLVRLESLVEDLSRALRMAGFVVPEKSVIDQLNPSKYASRHHPVAHYYDEEAISLVQDRDRVIIERFAYDAPIIS